MTKKIFIMMLCAAAIAVFSSQSSAQTARTAVGAAEASGTFREYFTGKFKGNSNEIRISALGKGKLGNRFNLLYPIHRRRGRRDGE